MVGRVFLFGIQAYARIKADTFSHTVLALCQKSGLKKVFLILF